MYVKKRITAAWDLNMAAFAVLVFGYLLSCLWAVDSGMALMGVVKFLPLLLFYVLVSGLTDEREKIDRVSSDAWMSYDCFFICYDAV